VLPLVVFGQQERVSWSTGASKQSLVAIDLLAGPTTFGSGQRLLIDGTRLPAERRLCGHMKSNARLRTLHANDRPAWSDPSDINPKLERRWFEFDRDAVLRQIDSTQAAVEGGAKELEMVAAEEIFAKSLSEMLLRTACALNTAARGLRALRGPIARASGYPQADKK
jgi:hypothetical protein